MEKHRESFKVIKELADLQGVTSVKADTETPVSKLFLTSWFRLGVELVEIDQHTIDPNGKPEYCRWSRKEQGRVTIVFSKVYSGFLARLHWI